MKCVKFVVYGRDIMQRDTMRVCAVVLSVTGEEHSGAANTNPWNACAIFGIEGLHECFGEDGGNCIVWNVSNSG
ncbi:hypothetical protein AGABI2DRAFT_192255 [Agaricus bisporus var. bisporus H97]|uniref:hypothetical protein n=1 Tax=Agaricus bisporus var. bisporus (strain H97 / ATCC MYA-4626 / FGSC 10389) TaxID=936046 RepID=UPI00029F5B89|nr:hypothetical protein AGABI2DRAFT_192255 [Agaricus bisporus var. bisporus H97]EKV48735.1 hypothetical protein AGABI2DRAFT_192255 [Agaricus bisporus var. bisporus H97]